MKLQYHSINSKISEIKNFEIIRHEKIKNIWQILITIRFAQFLSLGLSDVVNIMYIILKIGKSIIIQVSKHPKNWRETHFNFFSL